MTPGVIEGNSCQITVDTGSDISLVRPDILKGELGVPTTPVKDDCLDSNWNHHSPTEQS